MGAKIDGNANKVAGKAKELAGKATGNEEFEAKGDASRSRAQLRSA